MTEPKTAEVKVESIHDAAARLFAKEYHGRDFDEVCARAQIEWMEAAWDERAAPSHIGEADGMASQVEHAFAALEKFRDYGYAQWSVGAAIDVLRAALSAGMVAPAQSGWRGMEGAARALVAAIALYEPSMGEDDDELVQVRLGDLKALRQSLSAPGSPAEKGEGEEDEAYAIGKRDGYEEAVADIDRLTGGDGEYVFSTLPGEGCPDANAMKARIVERYTHPASDQSDTERMRAALSEVIDAALRQLSMMGRGKEPSPRLSEAIDNANKILGKTAALAEKEAGQ